MSTAVAVSEHEIHTNSFVDEVRSFIRRNYAVENVTCSEIVTVFKGHADLATRITTWVSRESIKHTFGRQKSARPPTKKMKIAFSALKDLESSGNLISFPEMLLRGHQSPVFSLELLSAFYFWTLAYDVPLPPISGTSTTLEVERIVDVFREYCRGRYHIVDNKLLSFQNMEIFKDQYLNFVNMRTPTNETPIMS